MKDSFMLHAEYRKQIEMLSDEQAGMLLKALIASMSDEPAEVEDVAVKILLSIMVDQAERDENLRGRRSKAAHGRWSKEHPDPDKVVQTDKKDSKCMQTDANACKPMQTDANACKPVQVDANACKAVQSCENGEKTDASGCKPMQTHANACKNDQEKTTLSHIYINNIESLNNTDKDNITEREREKRKRESVDKPRRFSPPSLEEVSNYRQFMLANGKAEYGSFSPERFVDFYASKNWMVGRNKMADWKAAVRNWVSRNKTDSRAAPYYTNRFNNFAGSTTDYDAVAAAIMANS